jgi:uncharacterized membrane protein YeaQ/YmgE (transglycosylase-associated protein family)
MIMRTDAQQGVILNVVVGIVGALLGGWLISPLVGVPTINQDAFSLPAMLVSLVGAVILLGDRQPVPPRQRPLTGVRATSGAPVFHHPSRRTSMSNENRTVGTTDASMPTAIR